MPPSLLGGVNVTEKPMPSNASAINLSKSRHSSASSALGFSAIALIKALEADFIISCISHFDSSSLLVFSADAQFFRVAASTSSICCGSYLEARVKASFSKPVFENINVLFRPEERALLSVCSTVSLSVFFFVCVLTSTPIESSMNRSFFDRSTTKSHSSSVREGVGLTVMFCRIEL
ncbi:hypothetical protein D3C80_1415780 [compost metagenome]